MKDKNEILKNIGFNEFCGEWFELTGAVNSETINKALKNHSGVKIPYIKNRIILDSPIILSSNNHLKFDEKQVIMQSPNTHTCLLRNKNIKNGEFGVTDKSVRDENMSVEGGIWNFKPDARCWSDSERSMTGSFGCIIISGAEEFSLRKMTIFDSAECGKGDGESSYGIQIGDCRNFVVSDINFENNKRDGVHVNGPAEFGHIRNIKGGKMGDDIIALNAWDWRESSLTFGDIENIVVENVSGEFNEIRLLPGEKLFDNGNKIKCDIKNCVFENISGVYTFKMYAQPNIKNAEEDTNDVSLSVGNMSCLMFRNIHFAKASAAGFHGLPVKGLFEICADCKKLFFENIYLDNTSEECESLDLRLVKVGPLSAVWKNGSDNPENWREVFDPNAICRVEKTFFKNIYFKEKKAVNPEEILKSVKLSVNNNYPKTEPRGGTGYGIISDVKII